MAWNQGAQKEVEEAKKTAKDWEERATASEQKAKELESRVKTMEDERAAEQAHVKQMNTEFQQLKDSITAREKNKETKPDEKPDFDLDPEGAVNSTIRPVAEIAVKNAVMTARILAQQNLDNADAASGGKKMDGRLFRAWGAQIDAEARKYPQTSLTTPDTWMGLFYYVKGIHSDELSDPETRKKDYSFLESGRGDTPPPPDKKDQDDKLTQEELNVCSRMGVKPEEYLKQKKALKFSAA